MPLTIKKDWSDKVMVVGCMDPAIRWRDFFPNLDVNSNIFRYPAVAGLIGSYDKKSERDENLNTQLGLATARGVRHFMACAHTECLGVRAVIHGSDADWLQHFLKLAVPIREQIPDASPEEQIKFVEEAIAHRTAENLETYPPFKAHRHEIEISYQKLILGEGLVETFHAAHDDHKPRIISTPQELIIPNGAPRSLIDVSSPDPELAFVHAGHAPGAPA